jgi:hypothetical protein
MLRAAEFDNRVRCQGSAVACSDRLEQPDCHNTFPVDQVEHPLELGPRATAPDFAPTACIWCLLAVAAGNVRAIITC